MSFRLISDQTPPVNYVGKAERATYTFRTMPEQIPGEQWLADQIIQRNREELEQQGCQLLRIRVWRDVSPTWHTDYRVEVTATSSPVFWTPVILGVLVVLALVISWKLLEVVEDIDWGKIPTPIAWSMPILAIAGVLLGVILLRRK